MKKSLEALNPQFLPPNSSAITTCVEAFAASWFRHVLEIRITEVVPQPSAFNLWFLLTLHLSRVDKGSPIGRNGPQ